MAPGRRAACLHRRLDRAHVAAHHYRYQPAAHMLLAHKVHVGRLDHRIRRFDRAHQSAGFDHTQSFLHTERLLTITKLE